MLQIPRLSPNLARIVQIDPVLIINKGDISEIQNVATDLCFGNFSDLLEPHQQHKLYRVLILSQLLLQFYVYSQQQQLQIINLSETNKTNLEQQICQLKQQYQQEFATKQQEIDQLKKQVDQYQEMSLKNDQNKVVVDTLNKMQEEWKNISIQVQQQQLSQNIRDSQSSRCETANLLLQVQQQQELQQKAINQQIEQQKLVKQQQKKCQTYQLEDQKYLLQKAIQETQNQPKQFNQQLIEKRNMDALPPISQQTQEKIQVDQIKQQINKFIDDEIIQQIEPQMQQNLLQHSQSQQLNAQTPELIQRQISIPLSERSVSARYVKKYRHVDRFGNKTQLPQTKQVSETDILNKLNKDKMLNKQDQLLNE